MSDWLRKRMHLHGRADPWRVLWWRCVQHPLGRPFCLPRRHKHWARDTMLTALATGRSRRCRYCNRLVVKPPFRASFTEAA